MTKPDDDIFTFETWSKDDWQSVDADELERLKLNALIGISDSLNVLSNIFEGTGEGKVFDNLINVRMVNKEGDPI